MYNIITMPFGDKSILTTITYGHKSLNVTANFYTRNGLLIRNIEVGFIYSPVFRGSNPIKAEWVIHKDRNTQLVPLIDNVEPYRLFDSIFSVLPKTLKRYLSDSDYREVIDLIPKVPDA